MWNWKLGNENFWIENLDLERYLKLWKRFFFFFFFWVLTQLWLSLSVWGWNFGPPTSLSLSFPFCFIFYQLFLPPLALFTFFFPLIFLLYFTISSYKKHFSKFLNSPSSISINISLDLCVLSIFVPHPFWWNPFSKTHFLCIKMASPSKGSSFLASHVKNMIQHLSGMMMMDFFKTLGPMLHIVM